MRVFSFSDDCFTDLAMKHGSNLHFAFLMLVLLAIFVRGAIPLGFMPDNSQNMAITICSGMTTKTIFVEDASSKAPQDQKEDHQPCPYATPVMADTTPLFNTADFISIAYAKFHPHQNAPVENGRVAIKSSLSQGPPDTFSA